MQGSSAYKALQQSLCEEAHRRFQALEQLQDVKRQLDKRTAQVQSWEQATQSGAARIAQLQDELARERRWSHLLETIICSASGCKRHPDVFARLWLNAGQRLAWPSC